MKKSIFLLTFTLLLFSCSSESDIIQNNSTNPINPTSNPTGTITDIEGNVYKTVKIGDQWWMSENLRTTKYCDGTSITYAPDFNSWENVNISRYPAYCYLYDDPKNNNPLGKLYNNYTINNKKNICPCDYRVPTENDWNVLKKTLGGMTQEGYESNNVGGKLMASNPLWDFKSDCITNESGFNALPSGMRTSFGNFYEMYNKFAYFWIADYSDNITAFILPSGVLNGKDCNIGVSNSFYTEPGLSIRCVKKAPYPNTLTAIDIDGNIYQTIDIGNQTWMTTNLNVSRYNNGDVIPQVQDYNQWKNLKTGAWCYYANDTSNGTVYGKLYNWYALHDNRGLAPAGYHIPSDQDWDRLVNFVGGYNIAGYELKESGNSHWSNPNAGTNIHGFSGLPGGYLSSNGFCCITESGRWWSTTPVLTNNVLNIKSFELIGGSSQMSQKFILASEGSSIRLIKD